MNQEEEYLKISGIQHFAFCRRQWALIHIEQQWEENLRTVEGELLHEKAHDVTFDEKRKGIITVRGMAIISNSLRVNGACDVVEFILSDKGVPIVGREGKYKILPVEYKDGEPKEDDIDILQLVAQAMCLEEMLCCTISEGAIYYEKTRHRQKVMITEELRIKVREMFDEMHQIYKRQYTPKVKPSKRCSACSLKNLCLPKLLKQKTVREYIEKHIVGEED